MYPPTHFLLPFFLAEILVRLGLLNHKFALLAGLLGMFIDIDHFIKFAIFHKDLSPRDAWNASVVKHERERTFIHHTLGFVLVTLIAFALFFYNRIWFLVVGLGYYSHMALDFFQTKLFKAKKVFRIKEEGFVIKLPLYELILDIMLVLGIGLLLTL